MTDRTGHSVFCRIRKIGPGDAIRLKTAQQGTLLKVGIIFRKKQPLRDSAARVIRINTCGGPLKPLIGKYATRPTSLEGDNTFSNWPYKIISINDEDIVLKNPVTKLLFHLDPSWNDNQWTLTPPNTSAKHFLLNLCKEISDSGKRRTTRQLIKKLYSQMDESCGSQLVNTDPWAELTQYVATKSNAKELIEIIEELKKLMGSLFIEWPPPPPSNKIYSSAHYDFHLSKDTSKKRKSLT